jgi:hypothetical protein
MLGIVILVDLLLIRRRCLQSEKVGLMRRSCLSVCDKLLKRFLKCNKETFTKAY